MINNYLDHDPAASAVKDYRDNTGALARAYDGHRGIDFDISTFREMDSGSVTLPVYRQPPH